MDAATRTANLLWDIEAVHFNAAEPFKLTSGWASPVYIDCRKLIAHLPARREIMALAVEQLARDVDIDKVDYIAGGETAGIAYAAWLSEALDKPMLYVRKKPKGFGRAAQIEGDMPEGAHVLLAEDLTTDGGSKLNFVNALRDAGASVSDVFSLFYYDIFPESKPMMDDAGLTLHALATWRNILHVARDRGRFNAETLDAVESFLQSPAEWSRAHGGAYERLKKGA